MRVALNKLCMCQGQGPHVGSLASRSAPAQLHDVSWAWHVSYAVRTAHLFFSALVDLETMG